MTHFTSSRMAKALRGVSFPASLQMLLSQAHFNRADNDTIAAIRALPDRTFRNADEVANMLPVIGR